MLKRLLVALTLAVSLFSAQDALASHFYSASITTRIPDPSTPRKVEVVVTMTLRRSFYSPLPNIDSQVNPLSSSFTVKNGSTTIATFATPLLTVNAIYANQDLFSAEGVFTVIVPGTAVGPFTVNFIACCRQSNIEGQNRDTELWLVHHFMLAAGTAVPNNGPIVGVLPVHFLSLNVVNTFQLPAVDPDGDALTYVLASTADSGLPVTTPVPSSHGALQLSASGLVTWQPKVIGLYAIQFRVSDGRGASVPMEMRLNVILDSQSDLPVIRINGSASPVTVPYYIGVQTSFTVSVTVQNPGVNSALLAASALPPDAGASVSLPAVLAANQTVTFTWTPPLGAAKAYLVEFQATDTQFGRTSSNFVVLQQMPVEQMYISGIMRDFGINDPGFNVGDGDNAIRLVSPALGADGKPVFAPTGTSTTVPVPSAQVFNSWWTKPGTVLSLVMNNVGTGDEDVFRFLGTDFAVVPPAVSGDRYFTYEAHSYFTYRPGQLLNFKSSDDLWIFIDGKLAVDLGGVHATQRTATFNADVFAAANDLRSGNTYRLDLFYAHRGSSGGHVSQLQLELNDTPLCDPYGGTTPAGLPMSTFVGRASSLVGGVTRLVNTTDVAPTGGAAWSQAMLPVVNGFSVEFDYKVTGTTADGFAFVIQSQAGNARGGDGSNLDYASIDHSLAVEFDSRSNSFLFDPPVSHISVHSFYDKPNSALEILTASGGPALGISITDPNRPIRINDGALHHARIEYTLSTEDVPAGSPAGTPSYGWLRVYLPGQTDPSVSNGDAIPFVEAQVDAFQIAKAFPNGRAYFGFTAGTDAGNQSQVEISNVTIKRPPVSASLSTLVALPASQPAGVPVSAVLALRNTCSARLRSSDGEVVTATSATTDGYSAPVTITNNNDGTYGLGYTPRVGGPWMVAVNVNSVPIRNSPFTSAVSPAVPTLTATGGSFPYNGQPRAATASATGVDNEILGPITFSYDGLVQAIHADTYDVVATYAGNTHYALATANTTLAITPVAPTLSVTGGTFTYNAQPHPAIATATGVLGEPLGPLTISYAPGASAPVNAGSYTATAGYAASTDYIAASANAIVKIDPATPTVHVNDANAIYDAAPHGTTATATGVSGEDLSAALLIRYDGNSPTAPVDAGSHPVIASIAAMGNYAVASDDGIVTIEKAMPTVEVNSATVTYNAQPHGVSATVKGIGGIVIGSPDAFTYDGSSAEPVNAHQYAVVATFNGALNYKSTTGNGSLTISPATPTVAVNSSTEVYNGLPHVVTGSVAGVGGEVLGPIAFEYDGSPFAPVNAKSYHVIGSFAASGNYADATGEGTLLINPATATIAVTGGSFLYDAQPHGATATATGILGEDLGSLTFSYSPGGSAPTNAGTYQATATLAARTNYATASGTATVTIDPATLLIHVNDVTETYDGQPHATTATATGIGGEDLSASLQLRYDINSPLAPVNAGSHPVLATFNASGNYSAASGTGTVTINKATPTVVVNSATVTYDALAHGVSGTVKGVGGVTIGSPDSFTYNSASEQPVNADEYAVIASFVGSPNYESATGNGSLIINKATPSVVVNDDSFTFNGTPHAATGSVKGVNNAPLGPLTFTYDGDPVAPSNARSYAVLGSFASTQNYEATSDTGTMTIAPASPTLVVTGGIFSYDGTAHVAAGSAKGVSGEDLGSLTFTYNGGSIAPMNAGTYAVVGSIAANGNYAAASKGGASILINKAASHVSWATPAAVTYGTPLSSAQLNASADVAGSFVYSPGSGVLGAGARTLNVTFTPTDATNYSGSTGSVTLTVNRAPLTITAADKSMAAGSAVPALTASYSGFVNGDAAASLDTPVSLSTSATSGSPAGAYAIVASGATDANYLVTHVNGTLTITPVVTPPSTSTKAQIAAIRQTLDALPKTGNKKNDKRIDDAVEEIADALNSKGWEDATHLTRRGERVFEDLEDAVESLMDVSPKIPAVTQAINSLVAMARQLAVTSLNDAIAAHARDRDIARAQAEIAEGDREKAQGHFHHAIDEYKEGWHRAERIMRRLDDNDEHDHHHGGHGKDPRRGDRW